jgi:DegV family protein with EDD domain
MKIKILTDSSVALPEDIVIKNNIGIVPIKISWEEKGIDGVIKSSELFKLMRENDDSSPKTSQPSIGDFKKAFEEGLEENDFVIYLSIATGTSGAYNSAIQAKKFFKSDDQEKIFIIDSFNLDGSLALYVLKAKELTERDLDIQEIITKLEIFKERLYLFGFVDTINWLERSGRLSSAKAILVRQAQKIGIRPLMGLKDGKVTGFGMKFKASDKREAILKELKDVVGDKKAYLVITHADSEEEANYLKDKLNQDFPNIEILFIEGINPIIGAHAGPGTVFFSFYLEEDNI